MVERRRPGTLEGAMVLLISTLLFAIITLLGLGGVVNDVLDALLASGDRHRVHRHIH